MLSSVWQSYLQLTSIPKPGKLRLPSMSTKTPSNNGQVSITKNTRREQRKTSLTCLNRWCHTNGCCHSLPWVLPLALLCFISNTFAETLIIFTEVTLLLLSGLVSRHSLSSTRSRPKYQWDPPSNHLEHSTDLMIKTVLWPTNILLMFNKLGLVLDPVVIFLYNDIKQGGGRAEC